MPIRHTECRWDEVSSVNAHSQSNKRLKQTYILSGRTVAEYTGRDRQAGVLTKVGTVLGCAYAVTVLGWPVCMLGCAYAVTVLGWPVCMLGVHMMSLCLGAFSHLVGQLVADRQLHSHLRNPFVVREHHRAAAHPAEALNESLYSSAVSWC